MLTIATPLLVALVWLVSLGVWLAPDRLGSSLLGEAWPATARHSVLVSITVTLGILFRASVLASKLAGSVALALRARVVYAVALVAGVGALRPATAEYGLMLVATAQFLGLASSLAAERRPIRVTGPVDAYKPGDVHK